MSELKKSTRTSFAEALVEIGEKNPDIVTIAADSASRYGDFIKKFPERSFNVGIAEQTMVGVAAGMALCGKVPVVTSYANFLVFRAAEQIRVDIAGNKLNVKLIGTDTGFSAAWLGFTHLALEDIAVIRAIPGIVIIDPADAAETYSATKAIFDYNGPVYMRLRGRKEEPLIFNEEVNFEIGKGQILKEGKDALIVACGGAVYDCLKAAEILQSKNIYTTVVNMATIRPLDENLLRDLTSFIDNIITVEHHNIIGGLGSAVAEFLTEKKPGVKHLRIGVKNRFGTAGSEDMLKREFGIDSESIAKTIENFLKKQ
ncbi:transketolase family protein [Thermoanaerobacter wiegelii]|uniref:Transketolase central region n=1 Tax=Thermoanaerobacter wiegelii Rt8.B1 TaxID=697303 RepID=G2MVK4_9THEO|nr:transketolase C-terminal domain-containing protein [Thermoanaerobacter wiegelii]AEM79132.1 Transketolase central region [Thermoanaerobacter wiegelii Rt8.B1]